MSRAQAALRRVTGNKHSQKQSTSPVQCFIKRDFLTNNERREITEYVLEHEQQFTASTVIPHGEPEPESDPSYRKSRVLYSLGEFAFVFKDRLYALLPDILACFNREPFPIGHLDIQVTASNDRDFFKVHQDNSSVEPSDVPLREISYVYYFHSEPKGFNGGQLKLYNSQDGQVQDSQKKISEMITPQQNILVAFPSSYDHEVLPVSCPSRSFRNSRFTINGWIIRKEEPIKQVDHQPDIQGLIDAVQRLNSAFPRFRPKLYLTLDEASEFAGLSSEYLQRLVQEGRLTAVEDGTLKIRCADLERL